MKTVDFQSLNVLAVDDDPNFLSILEGLLRSIGIAKTTTATSGSEAYAKMAASSRAIDCILCDLQMPHGNGLQLLKALRTGKIKSTRPDACFIFLTGSSQPTIVQIAAALDVNGYLVKPVTPAKIREAITKARMKYFAVDFKLYEAVTVPET